MIPIKPLQLSMPTDTELVITRDFDGPRDLVWAAWTDTKLFRRWMLGPPGWSMAVCELDVRVGGAWRIVWRDDSNGEQMEMGGVYKEVVRPELLVSTERLGPEAPETLQTIELTEKDGRTTLKQTLLYPSKETRDAADATGYAEGTEAMFVHLDEMLREMRGAPVTGASA